MLIWHLSVGGHYNLPGGFKLGSVFSRGKKDTFGVLYLLGYKHLDI